MSEALKIAMRAIKCGKNWSKVVFAKHSDQPTQTALAATAYSRINNQPTVNASSLPEVAYV